MADCSVKPKPSKPNYLIPPHIETTYSNASGLAFVEGEIMAGAQSLTGMADMCSLLSREIKITPPLNSCSKRWDSEPSASLSALVVDSELRFKALDISKLSSL